MSNVLKSGSYKHMELIKSLLPIMICEFPTHHTMIFKVTLYHKWFAIFNISKIN